MQDRYDITLELRTIQKKLNEVDLSANSGLTQLE